MKITRILALASMFMFLLATGAVAGDYGYSKGMAPDEKMGAASEEMVPSSESGPVTFFTGTFVALNDANQELLVRTEVPGIFGPEEMVAPFRIGDDTTISVCFKSLQECDSAAIGSEGWNILKTFEDRSDFSLANKNVVIVGDPESDRVVHVQIEYNTL